MVFIDTINWHQFVNIIDAAKKSIYIVLPGIDEELAELLVVIRKKNPQVSINVCIDNSEETIRNGYGEALGIEKLRSLNFNIYECNGNLVSFIISDDEGYFIFPQSKIFSNDPKGPNSVKLDPVTIQLLIQIFFPSVRPLEGMNMAQGDVINNSIKYFEKALSELEENGTSIPIIIFDDKKFMDIKKKLELNPPLPPDLKRLIDTYNAEVQYAELSFEGSNIQSRTIHYPKKALPVSSDELKQMLNSSMKLFGDLKGNPVFSKLNLLQQKVDKLRSEYLISIGCRPNKSILKKNKKLEFENKIKELQKEILKVQHDLPEMLKSEKEKTEKLINAELIKFFKKNPPKELKGIENKTEKQQMINDFIEVIIGSIDFPDMTKLTAKMILRCPIYDLTWDDFSDEQLLSEFEKKGILEKGKLDSIVAMKKAYDVKK